MSDRVDVKAIQAEGADHLSRDKNKAPRSGQPFTALSEQLADQAAHSEPEKPLTPAVMVVVGDHEWRFRTQPGCSSSSIHLDIPIETDDADESIRRKNNYKRWLDRQKLVDKKTGRARIAPSEIGKDGLLKADKAVFDLTGEYVLRFTPVRGKNGQRAMEAEYTTDEKVIADYIRGRLNRGDFAGEIYEDVRPILVEINGQQVYMTPHDDTARLAMAAAAAGD